ncbi:hypothetical protein ABW20_dc0100350 [Dactylellina cionopaga]|nr:hypothetical protein ABW20_dc0100350 [Dactylellina cionopaga]
MVALNTILTRKAVSWEETAKNFELRLATAKYPELLPTPTTDLVKRDSRSIGLAIWCSLSLSAALLDEDCKDIGLRAGASAIAGKFKEIAGGIKDGFRKKLSEQLTSIPGIEAKAFGVKWRFKWGDKSATTDIAHVLGSFQLTTVKSKIVCIGCYVDCKPEFTAIIKRSKGELADVVLKFQPNIEAKLDVGMKGTFHLGGDFNGVAKVVDSLLEALVIGEFAKILPDIANGPGVEMGVTTDVDMDAGFVFNTKGGSVSLIIGDEVSIETNGWDQLKFEPIWNFNQAGMTLEVNPYFRLGMGVGVEILQGVFKLGAFTGLEARITSKETKGLNGNNPCGMGNAGRGTLEETSVDVMWKVVSDPIIGTFLEKVIGAFGVEDPEFKGYYKNLYKKEKQSCMVWREPLDLPDRPTKPDFST